MVLPDGYELRAPTPDDLAAVADVLAADDVDDAGQVVLDEDFLQERWRRAGFDPAADAWLVLDGTGVIVGYAHVMREEPDIVESWGVIHPRHRERGIGSSLLDRIEERAMRLAVPPYRRFRHAINAGDRAAAAMLRARGLRPIRHFWHMRIDLTEPFVPGPAPEGIEIGGVVPPDDLRAVHAILDEAFRDDWGYHPEPFERWAEEYVSGPTFDPTLWLLARDEGRPVGALTANVFGDRGWVADLGVRPSHRGRGIAAALLRRSFTEFGARGLGNVLLNVDAENPTGATELYERVGMRVVKRWDLWERSVARASEAEEG